MNAEDIHRKFQEKIALISSYQGAARSSANSELSRTHLYLEHYPTEPGQTEPFMSVASFSYRSPVDGKSCIYGRQTLTAKQRILELTLHQNKQYQWLFVEAYEEFEDFLKSVYASAGYLDNSFWPLADYGEVTLAELPSKGWEWYLERARNKKNVPQSILRHFRKQLPDFEMMEKNNALGVDLRLAVALISQLRHHIVHTAGKVRNRGIFVEKVLSTVGLSGNGKQAAEHREYVEAYFFSEPYEDTIALLDRPHEKTRPGLGLYTSVFDELLDKLLATAHLLTGALCGYQAARAEAKNVE